MITETSAGDRARAAGRLPGAGPDRAGRPGGGHAAGTGPGSGSAARAATTPAAASG
ncbi:hypothetical protein VSR01_36470 [Actinacidiphila sp. DG2A-62]|uniref:hypothetical protein n=1 Tax=Actinacidiphila sp. DG2A-62 TaxID=3108821 RepID=UPI002DBB1165|nr:hypothetical protein [Actinacidiphila sp. DG2A-62]MEC3998689.1 hypothetical protein [Actinacidiphila sp. DG2A-62]